MQVWNKKNSLSHWSKMIKETVIPIDMVGHQM
jgi:hypothetical protein